MHTTTTKEDASLDYIRYKREARIDALLSDLNRTKE
jgi:hypothetical protein